MDEVAQKKTMDCHLSPDDFDQLSIIGRGAFARVALVRKRDSGVVYAMKILNKARFGTPRDALQVLAERQILSRLVCPFVVGLRFAFQTTQHLHLVLDYKPGGELFYHMRRLNRFEEKVAVFYAAELVLAIEFLHSHDIIYRDLKPENILLSREGHLALADFGLSKECRDDGTAKTLCGTPEYLAPEVIIGNLYSMSVDWWSLGILIFEMLAGRPPFYSRDQGVMYSKIITQPPNYARTNFSAPTIAIINAFLEKDPTKRLGCSDSGGVKIIKESEFFKEIDWLKLAKLEMKPPFIPTLLEKDDDTSNFDKEFTSLCPNVYDAVVPVQQCIQDLFLQFPYTNERADSVMDF